MVLVAGLGNPGDKYKDTRHNVGFTVIDILSERFHCDSTKQRFKGIFGEANKDEIKILLLKPMTYMNNSGESVASACNYYRVDSRDLIVVHDEMDLPLNRIRVKQGGGSAGHNGIKSIVRMLGTDDFARVRIGIGKPTDTTGTVSHVLSGFNIEEAKQLETIVERSADAVQEIIENGVESAMNIYNQREKVDEPNNEKQENHIKEV